MEEAHCRKRKRKSKRRNGGEASTEITQDGATQTGSTKGSTSNSSRKQISGPQESAQPPQSVPSALPDGWLDYSSIGELIPGIRILCCKTPIDNMSLYRFDSTSSDVLFTSQHFFDRLSHKKIKVGLVIDLTFSTRYYRGNEMELKHHVQHKKILVAGRSVPTERSFRTFKETVDTFLRSAPSDHVVAVHCTHGVNRTGWFVCRYMMEKASLSYEEAHRRFSDARGHSIHRDYLKEDLKRRTVLVPQSSTRSSHVCFTKDDDFETDRFD